MTTIASQITSLTIVYSTVYSDADKKKHQSSVSLAFVLGIHRGPVNSPHKWPVTRKIFPFDDVIMNFPSSKLYQFLVKVCTHFFVIDLSWTPHIFFVPFFMNLRWIWHGTSGVLWFFLVITVNRRIILTRRTGQIKIKVRNFSNM